MPTLTDEVHDASTNGVAPQEEPQGFGTSFYSAFGLDLEPESSGKNAVGTCPFCNKDRKFSLSLESSLWRCFGCNVGSSKSGGNAYTFLNLLHGASMLATTEADYQELCRDRGLLSSETPKAWGACKSILTGLWLLPGYNKDGKLCNLYRWVPLSSGKRTLKAAPGLKHGLFAPHSAQPLRKKVYLAEGPWDGMAAWELLRQAKDVSEGETLKLGVTGAEAASLLKEASVRAAPGCNIFNDDWVGLMADKDVVTLFDSDHPRLHCKPCKKTFSTILYERCPTCQGPLEGQVIQPPGMMGARRVARLVSRSAKTAKYLWWGDNGYDPSLGDGTDLRDCLRGTNLLARLDALTGVLNRIRPIPDDWLPGRGETAVSSGSTDIECLHCPNWTTLVNSWRLALHWTEGLDRALSIMMASVLSTRSAGDQLWVKIIGPPACGKSTLCEALSINKRHVKALSTIRGFHSGFKDPETGDNTSLILKMKDKALVTKDGDTILQMTDRDRILSEARDLYDKTARSDYRNGMGMDHEGVNMVWILCGTKALKLLDQSQLGARFVDSIICDQVDHDTEDLILDRVINRTCRTVGLRSNNDAESQFDPAMIKAMRLTGGYINTLCDDEGLLSKIQMPPESRRRIKFLGRYVASMRARPSISKEEDQHEKELPSRLVSQFARLAMCLAGVLSKTTTDDEVMRRVKQTAIDTARGKTVDYCHLLYKAAQAGVDPASLAIWLQEEEKAVRAYLRFLTKIQVAEMFKPIPKFKGQNPKARWRLTPYTATIYEEVKSYA